MVIGKNWNVKSERVKHDQNLESDYSLSESAKCQWDNHKVKTAKQ